MNSQKDTVSYKGKIVRPCTKRNELKTTRKTKTPCTHVPTIRCHEEIMSKLSNYNSDSDDYIRENPIHNYTGKTKALVSRKLICSKPADLYETSSAPVGLCIEKKIMGNKFSRSKSVPLSQKTQLDDSVDTIPVKLSSNNGDKLCKKNSKEKNKINVKSKEKSHKGPTWDQIFKKETSVKNNSKESKDNLQEHESLPNTPKKKVSINISNKPFENELRPTSNNNVYSRSNTDSPSSVESSPFEQVCSYDPVKTLDLLIKQMREKLITQPESSNLQKIIFDMENALQKISADNEGFAKIIQENNYTRLLLNGAQKTTFPSKVDSKGSNGHLDIMTLQRGLEESCLILQQLCIKQKENCQSHVREKEQIALQLAESRRLLAVAKSRERDYEATIGDLRLKIQQANIRNDQQFQSSEKITDIEFKLKAECERVEALKQIVQKLKNQLEENARQMKELNTQLHLKDLEIEKLKVLNEAKENNKNEKSEDNLDYLNLPLYKISEDDDDSFMTDSPLPTSAQERIMCSSQASSSPRHSPSPYNSWQHISSIYEQTNKHFQNDFRMDNFQIPALDLEMPTSGSSI